MEILVLEVGEKVPVGSGVVAVNKGDDSYGFLCRELQLLSNKAVQYQVPDGLGTVGIPLL